MADKSLFELATNIQRQIDKIYPPEVREKMTKLMALMEGKGGMLKLNNRNEILFAKYVQSVNTANVHPPTIPKIYLDMLAAKRALLPPNYERVVSSFAKLEKQFDLAQKMNPFFQRPQGDDEDVAEDFFCSLEITSATIEENLQTLSVLEETAMTLQQSLDIIEAQTVYPADGINEEATRENVNESNKEILAIRSLLTILFVVYPVDTDAVVILLSIAQGLKTALLTVKNVAKDWYVLVSLLKDTIRVAMFFYNRMKPKDRNDKPPVGSNLNKEQ